MSPKETNSNRVERAFDTLKHYVNEVLIETQQPNIGDVKYLLADLRHLCHRRNWDFDSANEASRLDFSNDQQKEKETQ